MQNTMQIWDDNHGAVQLAGGNYVVAHSCGKDQATKNVGGWGKWGPNLRVRVGCGLLKYVNVRGQSP